MNRSERKTLFMMKCISISFIFAIFLALLYFSNKKLVTHKKSIVSNNSIELLDKSLVKNITSYPWKDQVFAKALAPDQFKYINYWAEWCEPCIHEIPFLKELSKKWPNINFIFVNIDPPNKIDKARKKWRAIGDGLTTYYADNNKELMKMTIGLPYHQIYDKKNDLISHFAGSIDRRQKEINIFLKKLK